MSDEHPAPRLRLYNVAIAFKRPDGGIALGINGAVAATAEGAVAIIATGFARASPPDWQIVQVSSVEIPEAFLRQALAAIDGQAPPTHEIPTGRLN